MYLNFLPNKSNNQFCWGWRCSQQFYLNTKNIEQTTSKTNRHHLTMWEPPLTRIIIMHTMKLWKVLNWNDREIILYSLEYMLGLGEHRRRLCPRWYDRCNSMLSEIMLIILINNTIEFDEKITTEDDDDVCKHIRHNHANNNIGQGALKKRFMDRKMYFKKYKVSH